jgi:hypothetical protein
MAARWLVTLLAERDVHYDCVIVAITFALMLCSTSAMSVAAVLVPQISRELGWSVGEISGPIALRLALFGLMVPLAGALILAKDRFCVAGVPFERRVQPGRVFGGKRTRRLSAAKAWSNFEIRECA